MKASFDARKRYAYIFQALSPWSFWARFHSGFSGDVDELTKIFTEMDEILSKQIETCDLIPCPNLISNIGELVVANTSRCKIWRRCLLIDVKKDGTCHIFFVDGGFFTSVPSENIRLGISTELKEKPWSAVHCCLLNTQPVIGNKWMKRQQKAIASLMDGTVFEADVKENVPSKRRVVELLRLSDGKPLSKILFEKSLCTLCNDTPEQLASRAHQSPDSLSPFPLPEKLTESNSNISLTNSRSNAEQKNINTKFPLKLVIPSADFNKSGPESNAADFKGMTVPSSSWLKTLAHNASDSNVTHDDNQPLTKKRLPFDPPSADINDEKAFIDVFADNLLLSGDDVPEPYEWKQSDKSIGAGSFEPNSSPTAFSEARTQLRLANELNLTPPRHLSSRPTKSAKGQQHSESSGVLRAQTPKGSREHEDTKQSFDQARGQSQDQTRGQRRGFRRGARGRRGRVGRRSQRQPGLSKEEKVSDMICGLIGEMYDGADLNTVINRLEELRDSCTKGYHESGFQLSWGEFCIALVEVLQMQFDLKIKVKPEADASFAFNEQRLLLQLTCQLYLLSLDWQGTIHEMLRSLIVDHLLKWTSFLSRSRRIEKAGCFVFGGATQLILFPVGHALDNELFEADANRLYANIEECSLAKHLPDDLTDGFRSILMHHRNGWPKGSVAVPSVYAAYRPTVTSNSVNQTLDSFSVNNLIEFESPQRPTTCTTQASENMPQIENNFSPSNLPVQGPAAPDLLSQIVEDRHAVVKHVLTQLRLYHLLQQFIDCGLQDDLLDLPSDELYSLLKECGFKIGDSKLIQRYMQQHSYDQLKSASRVGATCTAETQSISETSIDDLLSSGEVNTSSPELSVLKPSPAVPVIQSGPVAEINVKPPSDWLT